MIWDHSVIFSIVRCVQMPLFCEFPVRIFTDVSEQMDSTPTEAEMRMRRGEGRVCWLSVGLYLAGIAHLIPVLLSLTFITVSLPGLFRLLSLIPPTSTVKFNTTHGLCLFVCCVYIGALSKKKNKLFCALTQLILLENACLLLVFVKVNFFSFCRRAFPLQ